MFPSPPRIGVRRATSISSSSLLSVARKWNASVRSSYSHTEQASVPVSCLARETIVLSTASRSRLELRAWLTSPRARSSWTERVSSPVRSCSSASRRVFSMAIAAWSANVSISATCPSLNGRGSYSRWIVITPRSSPALSMGIASTVRNGSTTSGPERRGPRRSAP